MPEDEYLFRRMDEQTELERLRRQEQVNDWQSMGALVHLGLRGGARCLEAGVGAGSMLRWMAAQVGPGGHVLGVDIDDRFFPTSAGPNVELRRDDIRATPLEPASFDVIHCRALLMHLQPADRHVVLGRFFGALRSGGWVVALDPALAVTIDVPPTRGNALWKRFLDAGIVGAAPAADFDLGPRLAPALAAAGFVDIDAYGSFGYPLVGGDYHTYILQSVETAGRAVFTATGGFSTTELDELLGHLRRGDVTIGYRATIAWGRKPPS